jgi:hypothetical protein
VFYTLLLVTFGIALAVSFLVARFFERPIGSILDRIVSDDVSRGWQRYLTFAIYVVGVSGGVRLYELERYIADASFRAPDQPPPVLTGERWVLEVYRTVIETLQSLAWMLLVFFLVALVAYVIVRAFELKRGRPERPEPPLRERGVD